jgi:hypothetical protein
MEAIKEITVWADGSTSNHTYLLDGNNLVAYIKKGDAQPFYFKNPIKGFSKSGRKFETLKVSPFKDWAKLLKAHIDVEEPPAYIKKVAGSKPGVFYTVNTEEHTCTCQGFTFRGACKHINELATA